MYSVAEPVLSDATVTTPVSITSSASSSALQIKEEIKPIELVKLPAELMAQVRHFV